ncbi:dCTP deaminase [Clostridium perfringens]
MILIDKNIKNLIKKGALIIDGYDENNVGSISYDLTISKIIIPDSEDKEIDTYEIAPNETVYIKSKEKLKIPNNIMGTIAEKNSVMRMGLEVSGPHYQPGHETYSFLRIHNISHNIIVLKKGKKIAQIIFEQLNEVPEVPYDKNPNASFNNEVKYLGFGKYKDEYSKDIARFNKVKEDIENKEGQIYSNILTFMGIFVSIFSFLTLNYDGFIKKDFPIDYILKLNLSLGFVITLFMGLILIFINKRKGKLYSWFIGIFTIILIILLFINIYWVLCK